MANEISHPRELAALVVRRVGVVSVIVPAGPAKQEGRKEGACCSIPSVVSVERQRL